MAIPDIGAFEYISLSANNASLSHFTSALSLVYNPTTFTVQSAAIGSSASAPVLLPGPWSTDFLGRSQQTLYKFEVWFGGAWVEVTSLGGINYLKPGMNVHIGGAGVSAAPVAATWSAQISNDNGIFHPLHPSSAYATLFQIGRKVRISLGRMHNGVAYYWPRLIGYMNAPTFQHGPRTVAISGNDYMKHLTDTVLRHPGNYFGALATFDSVSSSGVTGPELYDGADAFAVTADEANSIAAGWTAGASNVTVSSVADGGGGSTYVGKIVRGAAPGESYVHMADVGTVAQDTWYQISFKAKYVVGAEYGTFQIYQTIGGVLGPLSERLTLSDAGYADYSLLIFAKKSGALEARVSFSQKYSVENDEMRIDGLTIKKHDPVWFQYQLPTTCNGPYFVTLNGIPCYSGADNAPGLSAENLSNWHYDEKTRLLFFNKEWPIADGVQNLKIYYYTDQTPEGVVASLLATSGIYATAEAALAAMDYTATGVVLHRVQFDAGAPALDAIGTVCERVNYRFWFAADGTPTFKPAPVLGNVAFTFEKFGDFSAISDYQELGEIKNRIAIEGAEQDIFNVTAQRVSSKCKGEASDATSIAAYLEKTESISNALFESDDDCRDMAETRLAAAKDPKLYADLQTFANVVPLAVGDTVRWRVAFLVPYGTNYGDAEYDESTYGAGSAEAEFTGIIRDITFSGSSVSYKCEISSSGQALAWGTLAVLNCAVALTSSGTSMVGAATTLTVQAATVALAAEAPAVAAGASTELYQEADAMAMVGEANAINPHWSAFNATISAAADAGGGSTYVGLLVRGSALGAAYVHSTHVADIVLGTVYNFAMDYEYEVGDQLSTMRLYQTIGGVLTAIGAAHNLTSTAWAAMTFTFTALATAPLEMRFTFPSKESTDGDQIRIDDISVKP